MSYKLSANPTDEEMYLCEKKKLTAWKTETTQVCDKWIQNQNSNNIEKIMDVKTSIMDIISQVDIIVVYSKNH